MDVHPTKQKISNHFLELSKSMEVDDITVQKVVDSADISRQTFYYHFKDLIDLIEWMIESNLKFTLHNSLNASDATEALEIFVNQVYEQRKLFKQLQYSKNRVEVERILINAFRAYLIEVVKIYPPKLNLSLADLEIALEYHTHGVIGLLMTQVNKKDFNPKQLAKQLAQLAREIHEFN